MCLSASLQQKQNPSNYANDLIPNGNYGESKMFMCSSDRLGLHLKCPEQEESLPGIPGPNLDFKGGPRIPEIMCNILYENAAMKYPLVYELFSLEKLSKAKQKVLALTP